MTKFSTSLPLLLALWISPTLAQECQEQTTCFECVDSDCAWFKDSCLDSCDEAYNDASCFQAKNYLGLSTEEICALDVEILMGISTPFPSGAPTGVVTAAMTDAPTVAATTLAPTEGPTEMASETPTETISSAPTETASEAPTEMATMAPSGTPTMVVSEAPTEMATEMETEAATEMTTDASASQSEEVVNGDNILMGISTMAPSSATAEEPEDAMMMAENDNDPNEDLAGTTTDPPCVTITDVDAGLTTNADKNFTDGNSTLIICDEEIEEEEEAEINVDSGEMEIFDRLLVEEEEGEIMASAAAGKNQLFVSSLVAILLVAFYA